jgi:hypothetical protein
LTIYNTSSGLFNALNLPFRYEDYSINYEGQAYIGQQNIADRLNEVLGIFNWELELKEINVNMETFSVSVLGCLKAYDEEGKRWITRTQYGNDVMKIHRDETQPKAQAIEDAKKSAISDALKKCASWIGVASDVYQGKISAIRSSDSRYYPILRKYGLSNDQFKNGIPVLPDSYKEYYKQQDWFGIFESDLSGNGSSGSEGNTDPTNASVNNDNQSGRINGTKGNNTPQQIRIKALSPSRTNQDLTATFKAMLESHKEVMVQVPAELADQAARLVAPSIILNVKGWINESKEVVTLAKKGKIEVEPSKNSKAS